MTLTKIDIAERFCTELGLGQSKSLELVESVIEKIKATLASGDDVLVSGFGKFCVKTKRERKGRNPATGEVLMLKPSKIVTFKCSGKLKDKVNGP